MAFAKITTLEDQLNNLQHSWGRLVDTVYDDNDGSGVYEQCVNTWINAVGIQMYNIAEQFDTQFDWQGWFTANGGNELVATLRRRGCPNGATALLLAVDM